MYWVNGVYVDAWGNPVKEPAEKPQEAPSEAPRAVEVVDVEIDAGSDARKPRKRIITIDSE